jgi:putative oxidoreductase
MTSRTAISDVAAERRDAATAADAGLLLLRVLFGGLLFMHGSQKMFGWFDGTD